VTAFVKSSTEVAMKTVPLICVLALTLSSVRPAHAHAVLDHADPRVGSTLSAAPGAVTLAFTEPGEAAFSHIEVRDAAGQRIGAGPLQHPKPEVLSLPLPALAPGRYTVTWAVVSLDTHATSGRFTFVVKSP